MLPKKENTSHTPSLLPWYDPLQPPARCDARPRPATAVRRLAALCWRGNPLPQSFPPWRATKRRTPTLPPRPCWCDLPLVALPDLPRERAGARATPRCCATAVCGATLEELYCRGRAQTKCLGLAPHAPSPPPSQPPRPPHTQLALRRRPLPASLGLDDTPRCRARDRGGHTLHADRRTHLAMADAAGGDEPAGLEGWFTKAVR